MKKHSFRLPADQLMTSENVQNLRNIRNHYEKSIISINWRCLKTSQIHETLQIAMKKRSFSSHADQLMTSKNVPNAQNARNRNEKSHDFNQLMTSKNVRNSQNATNSNEIFMTCWSTDDSENVPNALNTRNRNENVNDFYQLMTSKNVRNARNATNSNEKPLISITCWSTDEVRTRSKCWKYKESQLKINNFNWLMTSQNVRNSRNATNSNEKVVIFIACWSTDDVQKRHKYTKYKESQWKITFASKSSGEKQMIWKLKAIGLLLGHGRGRPPRDKENLCGDLCGNCFFVGFHFPELANCSSTFVDYRRFSSIFGNFHNFCRCSSIFVNFHRFLSMLIDVCSSSMIFVDLHRFSSTFVDSRRFLSIFVNSHRFWRLKSVFEDYWYYLHEHQRSFALTKISVWRTLVLSASASTFIWLTKIGVWRILMLSASASKFICAYKNTCLENIDVICICIKVHLLLQKSVFGEYWCYLHQHQ